MPSLRYPVLLSRSSVSVVSIANLVLSTAIQLDTPSVHLRRIKLTTSSVDDRRAAAKIIYVKCSGERFGGTSLIFADYPNSVKTACSTARRKLTCRNRLDSFGRFIPPPAVGCIKRYRDPSVCPSACLSQPML